MPERFRNRERKPLRGSPIEDYAVIGDLETAALVNRSGSIDWLCWPTFSSGACFAALLGTADNGYWSICAADKILAVQRQYRPGTMILDTTFTTASGEVRLTDFMPPRGKHSDGPRARSFRRRVQRHSPDPLRTQWRAQACGVGSLMVARL